MAVRKRMRPIGTPVTNTCQACRSGSPSVRRSSFVCRLLLVSLVLFAGSFNSVDPEEYQIAGVFQSGNFTELAQVFQNTVDRLNSADGSDVSSNDTSFKALALPVGRFRSPPNLLVYVCDAVFHVNISAFVVIADQNTISTISIVTRHIGVPMLGYNTDKKSVLLRVSTV